MAIAFSIGIGLTNECNLRCAHCYRSDMVVERLTRSDVRRVCDAVTVGSMNLGVGENGLHAEYRGILDDLAARGIKTSITSNGLSVHTLADGQLTRLHSVELSLDFPTEREHDAFRGAGNYLIGVRLAHRELFDAVPWSTSDVLEVTLRRAAAAGLRAICLPSWFDVDTPDDLERLQTTLDTGNSTTACQTRRFLASWRR